MIPHPRIVKRFLRFLIVSLRLRDRFAKPIRFLPRNLALGTYQRVLLPRQLGASGRTDFPMLTRRHRGS